MAHEMSSGLFDPKTRRVEISCSTCSSLVGAYARDGLDGTEAVLDVLETHSILSDQPVKLGVTVGGSGQDCSCMVPGHLKCGTRCVEPDKCSGCQGG